MLRSITLSLLLFLSANAHAMLVTYDWSGSITASYISDTIMTGDFISGSFSYDTDATATLNSGWASYGGASSTFSIGGLSGAFSNQSVGIFNDFYTYGDQFDIRGHVSSGVTYSGDTMDGNDPTQLFIRLNDLSESVFTDLSLPDYVDLLDFPDNFGSRIDGWGLEFDVETLVLRDSNSSSVAEPASLLLFGLGLLGLGAMRKRD